MIGSESNVVQYLILTQQPATQYDIPFRYWNHDEISVVITTDTGDQTIDDTLYTVSSPNDTGILKFSSGYTFPLGATRLTIVRGLEIDQQTDFRNGDTFDAEILESTLDRMIACIQQLKNASDRSLKIAVTDDIDELVIPNQSARSLMLLGFDAEGNVITVLTSDIEQKLADALAAEESTINALSSANQAAYKATEQANRACMSKDKANEFAGYSFRAAKEAQRFLLSGQESAELSRGAARDATDQANSARLALEEITIAKGVILQAIEDATNAGLMTVVAEAEKLSELLEGIAYRIKYSEENARNYAGYAKAAAESVTQIALRVQDSVNTAIGAARDATDEAASALESCTSAQASAISTAQDKIIVTASKESANTSEIAALNSRIAAQGARDAALTALANMKNTYEEAQALYEQMQAVAKQVSIPTVLINGVLYTQETYSKRGRVFKKLTPVTGD